MPAGGQNVVHSLCRTGCRLHSPSRTQSLAPGSFGYGRSGRPAAGHAPLLTCRSSKVLLHLILALSGIAGVVSLVHVISPAPAQLFWSHLGPRSSLSVLCAWRSTAHYWLWSSPIPGPIGPRTAAPKLLPPLTYEHVAEPRTIPCYCLQDVMPLDNLHLKVLVPQRAEWSVTLQGLGAGGARGICPPRTVIGPPLP